jgi:histidinol-phosphate aminotransferase
MNRSSFQLSRRRFSQTLGVSAAYAALRPAFALSVPILQSAARASSTGVIRLSSNENPYGPSQTAIKAMAEASSIVWRYPDEYADVLVSTLANFHAVASENILLGNGSGEILKLAAAAFTGPDRRLITADPTFEAIGRHARTARSEVVAIPLRSDYRHDLTRMVDQPNLGLVYICNPNNPTASITPKKEIRAFLATARAETVVVVDEAYHHYVESNDYESLIPLVKDYPNLIVARTFSKIYGMAGLRCGYCVANPNLISQMRSHQTWDSVNTMALAAATASLTDKAQVEQGRQRNNEVKKYVYSELEKMGFKFIPSEANFLMIDLRRTAWPVITKLRGHQVEVGRVFPALPNFLRVTIGTKPQMEGFFAAFRQVMG